MDNPGISLFQGGDIQINNSKNIEEEEDLEDQLRRKEELQNLLQANLDDFKYDDSTINSSANVSVVSVDNLDQLYKDALLPNEQLKVLYDVRCREILALQNEYEKLKVEKSKEIESQKHKNLLLEGELRQLSISLKNSEHLLVEKAEAINSLNKNVQEKSGQISKLETKVLEYENDLVTYKSELSELQIKLHSQNGPFNLNAKYNSEELRQSLQAKIAKLESALDQEVKKFEISNSENKTLKNEVAELALEKNSLEKDNMTILKNLDEAQQQCRELVDVIEILKHENDHFRERIIEIDSKTNVNQAADSNERLKKMLVDKSVELDSLKIKLRCYEADLKELIEYRQLKGDLYKKEFQTCDNRRHTKDLLLMQNELQNYRRIIEDKNQQILNLNSNNTDLKERIEEMLLQTRNEIQNISSKYNMPQLEHMQKELEKAEYTVNMLSRKLEESEERRLSLLQKLKSESIQKDVETLVAELEKCRCDLAEERKLNQQVSKQLETLQQQPEGLKTIPLEEAKLGNTDMKNEYESLKKQLKNVMEHLEKSNNKEHPKIVEEIKVQMDDFLGQIDKETVEKGSIEERISSWKKLLNQIELQDPDEILKNQFKEAIMNLHASEEKLKASENALAIVEAAKSSLSADLKEYLNNLQQSEQTRHEIEQQVAHLKRLLQEKDYELSSLKLPEKMDKGHIDDADVRIENLKQEVKTLNEQVNAKDQDLALYLQTIQKYQQEKDETRKWLEKMTKEIDKLKQENARLDGELLETKKSSSNEEFKTRLEEELMKRELELRDEVQVEYQKRICDIEKRYQKTFKETTDLCKQQKLALEEQDKKFRESLKMVLTECDCCTTKLENEKAELAGQLQLVRHELDKYKTVTGAQEEKYLVMLKKMEKEAKKNNEAWKQWSKKVVCNCLDIEATNKKVRDRVLASMDRYDQEVATLQKLANAKAEKKTLKYAKNLKLDFKHS